MIVPLVFVAALTVRAVVSHVSRGKRAAQVKDTAGPAAYGMKLRFPKKPEPLTVSNRFAVLADLAEA